jgi:hypothetical protein
MPGVTADAPSGQPETEATAPLVIGLVADGPKAVFYCLDRRVSSRTKLAPAGPPGAHWAGPHQLAVWTAARVRGDLVGDPALGGIEAMAAQAASLGGVVMVDQAGAHPVRVDPGWVEERISVFDLTPLGIRLDDAAQAHPRSGGEGGEVSAAQRFMESRDHAAVGRCIDADRNRALDSITGDLSAVAAATAAAGAAWTLRASPNGASLVAWTPPGLGKSDPATLLAASLKALGARGVPARLDLLGLEVE